MPATSTTRNPQDGVWMGWGVFCTRLKGVLVFLFSQGNVYDKFGSTNYKGLFGRVNDMKAAQIPWLSFVTPLQGCLFFLGLAS